MAQLFMWSKFIAGIVKYVAQCRPQAIIIQFGQSIQSSQHNHRQDFTLHVEIGSAVVSNRPGKRD